MIEISELKKIIKSTHQNISDQELLDLINEVDYNQDGTINYSEFLSATIDVKKFFTDQRLLAIFHLFDTANTGKIHCSDIKYAFEKLGQEYEETDIEGMMKEHDLDGDKYLNFEEFKAMFKRRDYTKI
jgi:Ca2+-binding EF-hand superfamily protein